MADEISAQPHPPRRGMSHALKAWIRDLVVALGIAAFVIIFLYQPVKVEGTSMLPGLEDQERIFINKFVYRLRIHRAWRCGCLPISRRS